MVNNCGLHCTYYSNRILSWSKDNKLLILLGVLTFCLFVSTLSMAAQRNRARDDLASFRDSLATTEGPFDAECHLSIKTDFGHPSPVYLRNGAYLSPDEAGNITLRRSETILVACPGDSKRVSLAGQATSYDVLEAHCIVDSTFRVDRWIGPFKDISCNAAAWVSSEEVSGGCAGGMQLHRVGYKVKSVFYELYQACFDPDAVATLYVRREVSPMNLYVQADVGSRPAFIEGGLFKTVSMADVYRTKNQKIRVSEILGDETNNYISDNEYLTRGHLAARADFSLRAEQRASFHYVNTAPQWRAANSGAWAALEDGLRRRVHELGHPVTVYTGPLGVSALAGKPFYLTDDQNNNGLVPVPMYFFKLVYDAPTKTAIAFISINNSALNSTASEDLDICSSVCDQYPWLRWKGDGNACCQYEDLAEMARLPSLEVNGLLKL